MICVYIVNEESAYIAMLSQSLIMLRQHNPDLTVKIYFILDGKKDTRPLYTIRSIRNATSNLPNNKEKLIDLCDKLNVEIKYRVYNEKNNYHPLHRVILKEVEDDTVLLLDADTFIYGNIEHFPSFYSGFDFVATPNSWGKFQKIPILNFQPFNSGVVLCQNGTFCKWMSAIEGYCEELMNGRHELSNWFKSVNSSATGREELAASLFVYDSDIKYTYFEDKHVRIENGESLILHTLTPNWLSYYNKFFNKPKKTIIFKPLLKK